MILIFLDQAILSIVSLYNVHCIVSQQNLGTIAYESQHYESEEKLVSFTYLPHLHADGMFLLNIPGFTDIASETYRVIHDFKAGKNSVLLIIYFMIYSIYFCGNQWTIVLWRNMIEMPVYGILHIGNYYICFPSLMNVGIRLQ